MAKDEEVRCVLRKTGYQVLELNYDAYSDKSRDQLYAEVLYLLGIDVEFRRKARRALPANTQAVKA